MKFTIISASISTLLAIVLATIHSVEGCGNKQDCCAGPCDLEGPSWGCDSMCACGCDNDNDNNARRLADDGGFWYSQKVVNCLDAYYDGKVVVKENHIFFIAEPQNKDLMCPALAIDYGYMEADHDIIAPHVTILDESPPDGLALDHSLTLGSLSETLSQMNLSDYKLSMEEYNLFGNNCATFLLDLCKKIGLDYHEPATNANIVNYIGKSLATNQHFFNKIKEAYIEENTGIFQQIKFSVWSYYVGDEGMARALVKNNMDIVE
jgi:hypothetical protein